VNELVNRVTDLPTTGLQEKGETMIQKQMLAGLVAVLGPVMQGGVLPLVR
jgi:hypothetical protein